jgi:hypothetical protein
MLWRKCKNLPNGANSKSDTDSPQILLDMQMPNMKAVRSDKNVAQRRRKSVIDSYFYEKNSERRAGEIKQWESGEKMK